MIVHTRQAGTPQAPAPDRWECNCSDPGVLLALIEPDGVVDIKVRDRRYRVEGGTVTVTCPKCGREHTRR